VSWARGTSIVADLARVAQLTGQQDLANLEAGGEITIAQLLISASDSIYDQLQADGVDPTGITNETVYEEVVAWNLLARLFMLGYIQAPAGLADPESAYSWSDYYYQRKRPTLSADDESRLPHEALPVVTNLTFPRSSPTGTLSLWQI
jgi:hypothetical protein